MNKSEKEYMRGGKDMSDILYSLFRKMSTEIRMDGGEYFKELHARFNILVTK